MGFMESAVVVYLRKIYYPEGFSFPLVPIDILIGKVEFFREVATIFILLAAGMMAGRNRVDRFAWFIFSFAIWDLSYYLFLKIILDWPESLLTMDILFLIPFPWVGPVLAPCIVACTMIILSYVLLTPANDNSPVKILITDWVLMITGSLIVIFSFMLDFIRYNNSVTGNMLPWTLSGNQPVFADASQYVPENFNWLIFIAGEFLILCAVVRLFLRSK